MVCFGDGLEILNMTNDGMPCNAVSQGGWLCLSVSIFVCDRHSTLRQLKPGGNLCSLPLALRFPWG